MNFRPAFQALAGMALCLGMGLAAVAQPRAPAQAPPPIDYKSASTWLCLPGRADACAVDQSAMIVGTGGTARLEQFILPAREPTIDCFYVYPTVSQDSATYSDMVPGPEERRILQAQFARFGKGCRLYAPMYRQLTQTAINTAMAQPGGVETLRAAPLPPGGGPYADVLSAFRTYLSDNNQGRGFVLIGDGQGASLLTRLIAEEIDGKPVQRQLVSAILLGASVQVPIGGGVVGGTFRSIPLCPRDSQIGCVVTYSSFRDTAGPPPDALFGKPGSGTIAACTNPANLRTGKGDPDSYFSAQGNVASPAPNWTGDVWAPVGTPFVKIPGLVATQCVNNTLGSYLAVHVNGEPRDARADDIGGDMIHGGKVDPAWGLNLINMNLSLGDLVDMVSLQARIWRPAASR